MAFLIDAVEASIICVLSYFLWLQLRPFFVKTPLSYIPGPPRRSWLKGNFDQIFDRNGLEFHREIVKKYGAVVRLSGLFGSEQLYVSDPRALHHIVIKDQYVYEETSSFIASNIITFGTGLLSTLGDHHRQQRKLLNPVFSIKHMRGLIGVFYPIAHELRDVLAQKVQSGEEEIDIMRWMSRAALEYIGQGGLGYSFDALNENKTNKYNDAIKMFVPLSFKLALFSTFMPYIINLGSPAFRRQLTDWVPSKDIRHAKRIIDIMDETSREIYGKKKEALAGDDEAVVKQVGQGKDIMSVLMRANMAADEQDKLPEEELIGQMNTFIFAGHDTTSGALSRTLHLLSLHPDVQDKLRAEVSQARREKGDLDYDTLMNLPYLDAVCRETLRVHPPVSFISRTTRKDIIMPLQSPIKAVDGKTDILEIPIKNNTEVIISILGANLSKEIWGEDAEEWKPERWLKTMPESVAAAHLPGVYSSMMTFLGGGRACIGFKFAEMEMKLVLSVLLESFAFAPTKDIFWAMGGLRSPTVKGSKDITPSLPLKVSLVQKC